MAACRLGCLMLGLGLKSTTALRNSHGSSQLTVAQDCQYVPPSQVSQSQSYPGMGSLTDPDWVATDNTSADGKRDLFYAYGPMFEGKGQIGAWKYDEQDNFIKFWWSKSHCMGMVGKGGCSNGKGNEPGVASVSLNPSASLTWRGYTLTYKFHENTHVQSLGGTMKLVHIGDKWRLQAENGCFIDHMLVCSQSDHITVFKDALERECSGSCQEGLCTTIPNNQPAANDEDEQQDSVRSVSDSKRSNGNPNDAEAANLHEANPDEDTTSTALDSTTMSSTAAATTITTTTPTTREDATTTPTTREDATTTPTTREDATTTPTTTEAATTTPTTTEDATTTPTTTEDAATPETGSEDSTTTITETTVTTTTTATATAPVTTTTPEAELEDSTTIVAQTTIATTATSTPPAASTTSEIEPDDSTTMVTQATIATTATSTPPAASTTSKAGSDDSTMTTETTTTTTSTSAPGIATTTKSESGASRNSFGMGVATLLFVTALALSEV